MKVNSKVLSLPPYLSTSWKNIALLHVEQKGAETLLIISLHSGAQIEVPHLDAQTLEAIFRAHAESIEDETATPKFPFKANPPQPNALPNLTGGADQLVSFNIPLPFGVGNIENFSALLQHNVEQADSPDLPADVLNKIAEIARTVGADDPDALPKAEPHCNCMHCQFARAMRGEEKELDLIAEETVTAEDLTFRGWDISQTSEKLYLVTNPLDQKEQFHVFLGTPIGCTCGEKNCEHVRAVLNS